MILRLLRFLIWVAIFSWVVWMVKRLVAMIRSGEGARRTAGGTPASRTLVQDPVCGGYVAPDAGVALRLEGRAHRFCSTECRDRYVAELQSTGEKKPGA